jgi:hypothetical protein
MISRVTPCVVSVGQCHSCALAKTNQFHYWKSSPSTKVKVSDPKILCGVGCTQVEYTVLSFWFSHRLTHLWMFIVEVGQILPETARMRITSTIEHTLCAFARTDTLTRMETQVPDRVNCVQPVIFVLGGHSNSVQCTPTNQPLERQVVYRAQAPQTNMGFTCCVDWKNS